MRPARTRCPRCGGGNLGRQVGAPPCDCCFDCGHGWAFYGCLNAYDGRRLFNQGFHEQLREVAAGRSHNWPGRKEVLMSVADELVMLREKVAKLQAERDLLMGAFLTPEADFATEEEFEAWEPVSGEPIPTTGRWWASLPGRPVATADLTRHDDWESGAAWVLQRLAESIATPAPSHSKC